jgi:hypothetical protein
MALGKFMQKIQVAPSVSSSEDDLDLDVVSVEETDDEEQSEIVGEVISSVVEEEIPVAEPATPKPKPVAEPAAPKPSPSPKKKPVESTMKNPDVEVEVEEVELEVGNDVEVVAEETEEPSQFRKPETEYVKTISVADWQVFVKVLFQVFDNCQTVHNGKHERNMRRYNYPVAVETDTGEEKVINIEFDGQYKDAVVWRDPQQTGRRAVDFDLHTLKIGLRDSTRFVINTVTNKWVGKAPTPEQASKARALLNPTK